MKKTVLVTGASRGIGRAIAKKFLDEGHIVYGTYYSSKNKMEELQEEYGEERLKICGPYNFCDIDDINAFVDSILGIEFDTLVLNAGMFSENDDFLNFDINEFKQVMNCNFYAPLIISTRLQSYVKNGGNLILMSSNDAYSGAFGSMSYSISKSAIISLMKCLCVNYGRKKIRVNSIAPGAINTDMNTPEQEFEAPLWTPIKRIAQPYEVANVVYFLSSDESGFINGENITIDGGYSQTSILLKKEIDRSRQFVGYEYLNEKMKNMSRGDIAYCLDTTPEYGWIDNKDEEQYINNNITAMENGAIINRIIVVSKDKYEKVKNNDLIKFAVENTKQNSQTILVDNDEVKLVCPNEYKSFGKGFVIFIKSDGTKEVFIDSFSDNENVGYLIDSEIVIEQLIEKFENVMKKINRNQIKSIDLNK